MQRGRGNGNHISGWKQLTGDTTAPYLSQLEKETKMTRNHEELKSRFIATLAETKRTGIESVLEKLKAVGFYSAPASSRFHCAYEGGLLEHSMCVYDQAVAIRGVEIALHPEISKAIPPESVAIAALLHDVCKVDVYKKVEKFRKDKDGRWEKYLAWETDHAKMPLGHGEKSVIRLLRMGLDLTTDEILAIRWHMGAWDLSEYGDARGSFNAACDKAPLLPIIIAADGLASRISERRDVA